VERIDAREDYGEERINLVGLCDGTLIHVTYTERGERIRSISARRAERYEQDDYYRENLALQVGGAALKRLGGGAMTFVGSISGLRSVPGQAIYGAAKAALHHLVRCAAHEFGPAGIRVNAVAPSFVRTPRLEARLDEAFWQRLETTIPMRRVGQPADVAAAVLFLQSGLARYVTANVLTLDGGTSAVAALIPP
jgi:NAD(P)-dependent dehydrogenase (short-subunit alcohol dehydrogenase family)